MGSLLKGLVAVAATGLVAIGVLGSVEALPAAAAVSPPEWKVSSVSSPTTLVAGGSGSEVEVRVTNVGGASAKGSPTAIVVEDSLPVGLETTEVTGYDMYSAELSFNGIRPFGGEMTCSSASPIKFSCEYGGEVLSGDTLTLDAIVNVAGGGLAAGSRNEATVKGGGVSPAAGSGPLETGTAPAEYGVDPESLVVAPSTTQAGAHPNLTTSFVLTTKAFNEPAENPRDLRFDLPPGFVGNTTKLARCPIGRAFRFQCPTSTIVGVATVTVGGGGEAIVFTLPVYNIAPQPGEPAAFEFTAQLVPVRLDTSVLSNGEYGVQVSTTDIAELATVMSATVTLWGVPADHNGPGPIAFAFEAEEAGVPAIGGPNPTLIRTPLLTNPTQCTTPLEATLETDSWKTAGKWRSQTTQVGTMTGCENLAFSPTFTMIPDKLEPGTAAGYKLDLTTPQNEEPDGLTSPDVRDVSLTLPQGVVTSPSVASGLASCSDAQFGLHSGTADTCPSNAQIGTVEVETPALPNPLKGKVYIGSPECGVCGESDAAEGRLVRLFAQILGEGEDGVLVKLEGHGRIDQSDGQITATFANDPQLPFSQFKFVLDGGPRAALANPRGCGPLQSALDITPWSTPTTPDVTLTSGFEINEPKPCFALGAQFAPVLVAGMKTSRAGGFGHLSVGFERQDADQYITGLALRLPPGLAGILAKVPLCKEPQAALGTCGPESLIGHMQALVGPGSEPYLVGGGQVFLTEGHDGAPFGVSIVLPAVAGPFTLAGLNGNGTPGHGDVVVQGAISVDPNTAQVTVTTDALPTALDGIPLQLRGANVTIDREGFMFNPTNCNEQKIEGTLTSQQGTKAAVSTRFQAANCATLAFKPKFAVSTEQRTSRAGGASLDVKVSYPAGSEANIHSVKVSLPKKLPSRLKTIQQACPEATFAANPASCPIASNIGTAKATTPVLSVPLSGPAYLVSHGGAAFPDLVVILQGEGVRVDLTGSIFIAKDGITSSTFGSVPDVPISSFDLKLPRGSHSALTAALPKKAASKLCGSKLTMPTLITGQNGAQIKQSTKITVTGCPKPKKHPAKHAKKARKAKS